MEDREQKELEIESLEVVELEGNELEEVGGGGSIEDQSIIGPGPNGSCPGSPGPNGSC